MKTETNGITRLYEKCRVNTTWFEHHISQGERSGKVRNEAVTKCILNRRKTWQS